MQSVLTALHTFYLSLHILYMQFRFNFKIIYCFLLFLNFVIVLGLLFCRLVPSFTLLVNNFLYFYVKILFLGTQKFKLRLLKKFLSYIPRKGIKLQINKLFHEIVGPLHKVLLVFLYFFLITLYIWVVLKLATKFSSRFFQVSSDILNSIGMRLKLTTIWIFVSFNFCLLLIPFS